MDSGFKLEYSVIKVLHGKYEKKQIEFKAYDHYGPPRFLKYPHVILFLSRYRGELYHEKYRFFDVYPTKNGRWAICGDTNRFRSSYTRKLKPVKVSFKTPMIYDLRKLHPRLAWKKSKDPEEMSKYVNMQSLLSLYSKQYFKIKHDKAICLGQGIYAEDLVNTRYSKDPLTQ